MNTPQRRIPIQWSDEEISSLRIHLAGIPAPILSWPRNPLSGTTIAETERLIISEYWRANPTLIEILQPIFYKVAAAQSGSKKHQ